MEKIALKSKYSLYNELRTLLRISIPLVAANTIFILQELIDTIMLGNYSTVSLAAVSLAGAYLFAIFLPATGLYYAIGSQVAEARSQSDSSRVKLHQCNAVILSAIYGILVWPLLIYSDLIFGLGNITDDLVSEAHSYTRIYAFSLLPYLLFKYYRAMYSGLGETSAIATSVAISALVNVSVNYLLIYGNFGFPELGIVGAAIATGAALTVAALICEIQALKNHHQVSLYNINPKWDPKGLAGSIRLGGPIAVTFLGETGLYYVLTFIAASFGATALGAHGIAFQVVCIFFGVYGGIHQGVVPYISESLGTKNWTQLKTRRRMSWYVATTFSLLASAIILLQPNLFINLFTVKLGFEDGHELRLLMPTMLLLSAIFLFLDTLDGNLLALAAGIQDTAAAMWIKLFTSWIIGIPLAYCLGVIMEFGIVGLWSGWAISVFIAVVMCEIHFEFAIKKLTRNIGLSSSDR